MAVEIVMPRMGLTMESGTVVAWLKREGEPTKAGEPLLEIETDKTTVEIESPGEGKLGGILAQPGDTVPVGEVIGYLLADGEDAPMSRDNVADTSLDQPDSRISAPILAQPVLDDVSIVKASPAARHLARELGVDLASVAGTGPGGRVVAWNVQVVASRQESFSAVDVKASPLAHSVAKDLGIDLGRVSGSGISGRITREDVERAGQMRTEEAVGALGVERVSRTHQVMAERMAASFSTVPHFYLSIEADARPLVSLRQAILPKIEQKFGVRVTFTDLLVRLCALALAEHREMMAQWDGGGLRALSSVSVGIAVDSPGGLVVPVIRDADRITISEVARMRMALVERARDGKLKPQDMETGAFTITNLGAFGVDSFHAIINAPQAAILAVGQVKERPFVENGEVIAADTIHLTLSVDHRVVDGATAARFFSDLVELIETPALAI